ncbi:MAG: alpha/beta hydrolase [Pseudochelatococcus sp.]|jgi:alpha-beta hydrolase superfamily lysophospholipase|uniref:alpha/beta hydrolase n=1 Tax=Pseudochelatococcus sp. TaxID=2020869 RepID=UPI003D8F609C
MGQVTLADARTAEAANPQGPKQRAVLFIHGAWLTPACWDEFRQPFDAAGFATLAPAWPGLDGPVEDLRAASDPRLGALSINEITDHYARIVAALDTPPLLVGHSFGGLVVQLLLARGLGAAGAALAPAPFAGLWPDPVSLGSAILVGLDWRGWNQPYDIARDVFDTRVANTLPPRRRGEIYDSTVPSPGRLYGEAATGLGTFLWPPARQAPLLLIAAGEDRLIAPALVFNAWQWQTLAPARTDYDLAEGVCHLLIFEQKGKEVATRVIAWARENGVTPQAANESTAFR